MNFEFSEKYTGYQKKLCEVDLHIQGLLDKGAVSVEVKGLSKSYSAKQRRSLHLWCDMCANYLNDNGIPCYLPTLNLMSKLSKNQFPIQIDHNDLIEQQWTMLIFKELRYKYILNAMLGKESTEDQNSVDPSHVAVQIINAYAINGYNLPDWPSLR